MDPTDPGEFNHNTILLVLKPVYSGSDRFIVAFMHRQKKELYSIHFLIISLFSLCGNRINSTGSVMDSI